MDKEEILEKNREDNRGADERFRILNQRQSSVMVGAMLVVWAALFLWDFAHGQDTSAPAAIKLSLVCGLLAAFGVVSFAAKHIMLTM